jgi:3-isopropylmalate/(R)-2-methylmalate dehydratase small subunit
MRRFTNHTGIACPLGLANVDTDQIIPARFLRRAKGSGLGDVLFADLRFADGREVDDFPLNRAPWRNASLLVARRNFGSGSSREAAVYALTEFGIHAVLAPSYGDIFAANAVKNGLVPALLAATDIEDLLAALAAKPDLPVSIDLEALRVTWGNRHASFAIDPTQRDQLLSGWDDVEMTRSFATAIHAFKRRDTGRRPWMRPPNVT